MTAKSSPSPIDILTNPDPHLESDLSLTDSKYALFIDSKQQEPIAPRELPSERRAVTRQFVLDDQVFYMVVGLFDDGQPAELFIHAPHLEPDTAQLLHQFATAISIGLQYGIPISVYSNEFLGVHHHVIQEMFRWLTARFEPTKTTTLDSLSKPVSIETED